jgi:hypothetical protein
MNPQRGQALAETAVAVVLLATVLTAMPCLIAYQDSQRAALRSARDVSYMAGWSGQASQTAIDVRVRAATAELPWRHPADGALLLAGDESSTVVHQDSAPPGKADALMDFIARPLGESSGSTQGSLPLSRVGYHDVTVQLHVPAMRGAPEPFSKVELPLTERAAVLTESWNAGSPDQVKERVRGVVPSASLGKVAEPVRALAAPLRLIEPAFAALCIGRIEPDRLPRTRLGTAEGRAPADRMVEEPCR